MYNLKVDNAKWAKLINKSVSAGIWAVNAPPKSSPVGRTLKTFMRKRLKKKLKSLPYRGRLFTV